MRCVWVVVVAGVARTFGSTKYSSNRSEKNLSNHRAVVAPAQPPPTMITVGFRAPVPSAPAAAPPFGRSRRAAVVSSRRTLSSFLAHAARAVSSA